MSGGFGRYGDVLGRLARDTQLSHGSRHETLQHLTREIALAMDVSLVSFWTYEQEGQSILSECSFDRKTDQWTSGVRLTREDHPRYFEHLSHQRLLVVDDCFTDPIMQDFIDSYLIPYDVHALIDAPVFFDGKMVGIICCEVVGSKRHWSEEDKFFVSSGSDFVGRVLEADQRHQYERELQTQLIAENIRRSEIQLKAILSGLPYPVALLDTELRYLALSEQWRRQFPFDVPDPLGMRVDEAQKFYRPEWLHSLKRCLAGETMGEAEQMIDTGTRTMWLTWHLSPWRNLNGDIGGVVLVCDDITERKETEAHVRQSTKLTALGEMAGGIAHEINNPLSILKGFIDLMRRQIQRGQMDLTLFSGYLERSYSTVDRISRIVAGMKRITRDASMEPMRPYGVNAVVEDVLDFVREKFRISGVNLELKFLEEERSANIRPVEISQVLLNLLMNSFHAVEGMENGWVMIQCKVSNDLVLIIIEDSGKGIAEKDREKIFQPFFTTKEAGQGTGLGLSISKRIVDEHRGRLFLDTTAPCTRFVLELQLAP